MGVAAIYEDVDAEESSEERSEVEEGDHLRLEAEEEALLRLEEGGVGSEDSGSTTLSSRRRLVEERGEGWELRDRSWSLWRL